MDKKVLVILGIIALVLVSGCVQKPIEEEQKLEFSSEEEEQGWYYGDLNQKKPGTPDYWVHRGEGTRSAQWFNPIQSDEDVCTALSNVISQIENSISVSCETNDECESRAYIDSATNAVKCFRRGEDGLADYDYLANVYREYSCPVSLGGAPYSQVSCECIENECTAKNEP